MTDIMSEEQADLIVSYYQNKYKKEIENARTLQSNLGVSSSNRTTEGPRGTLNR